MFAWGPLQLAIDNRSQVPQILAGNMESFPTSFRDGKMFQGTPSFG
jgi:hypothetical protein